MTIEEKISDYISVLKKYNETTNVYSKSAYDKLDFHIENCRLLGFHMKQKGPIFDFGSGSGLPSVILSIIKPNTRIFAIDSTLKKATFLKHVKSELNLENLTVVHQDVLTFLRTEKTRPRYITAKAFAPLPKILNICEKIKFKGQELWVPISKNQKLEIQEMNLQGSCFVETNSHIFLKYLL
ncbi:hypothetical protein HOG98_07370 [bacterium]|jgi:16S rRNA (guanine527-N7)-methyltransferase|nr:hypothetical protein [bacterium]